MAFAAGQPLFGKGMFTIDPNSTPEQIATKRALMQAIMPRFGSARYAGEGLGQLATGIAMGAQGRKLDKIEGEGRDKANALFSGILGAASAPQGGFSVLGAPPVDPMSPEAIGADAMAAIGKGPGDRIKAGLVARGMPEHIADGFVMNFEDESGLNPGINEIAPIVPGSRGGFGLAQWTGPRRKALEAYAAERGKPVSDMDVQLDFLMTELQGPESAAWQAISGAKDAGEAGAAIVNEFLRPAEEHRARRVAEYTGGNSAANTAVPQVPQDQLMALLSNPWLSQEQRGMLSTIMEAQLQAGDPMRQIEVQKAQLELERAQNPQPPGPPEEYTNRIFMAQAAGLEPGSPEFQNYLLTGELPNATSDLPASFAALDLQAQAAGYKPGTPQYQEFMRNGGGSGTPAAFTALDMQAQAAGFMPGTPQYQEFMATRGAGLAASAKVKGEATAEAEIAAPGDVATADTTLGYIESLRNHPGRLMGTGGSSFLGMVPGTSAKEFQIEVERLKSGAFMTAIEQLRGMGALSNAEGQTATAAVAALDATGTEEGFMKRLEEYEAIVKRGRERAAKRIRVDDGAATKPAGNGSKLKFNPQTGDFE